LRLKILKKLRTASLNSEFTGSYKKSARIILIFQAGQWIIFENLYPYQDHEKRLIIQQFHLQYLLNKNNVQLKCQDTGILPILIKTNLPSNFKND